MKSGAVHGIILTTPILYLTGCPHRLAAKGRQPPGTGNYTIHAPRSWYNNRKALIIPALCPHAAGAAGRAIIPFTLCVHGIITPRRRGGTRRSGVATLENQRFSPCEHFTTKRRRCGTARGKGRLQTLRVCFCGIITAKRRNENFTVSMPCRRRKGALFHWRRKPAHIVLSGSL